MTYLREPVIGNFRPSRSERAKGKPKREREGNDEAYLSLLRQLPCCICGHTPAGTVHHLKQGTGTRGTNMRSTDRFGLPMCKFGFSSGGQDCHSQVERIGSRKEQAWFRERGIDCLDLAGALWSNKHSLEAMMSVLQAHREGK